MDILKCFNHAVAYMEENLCGDINMDRVAQIACVTKDSFLRFFSYVSGMSLNTYIRRRRLTLAAYELRNTEIKVIDAAIKYGYGSADAFTKAFVKQHGITPTAARSLQQEIHVYPSVSFHVLVKGAEKMRFKLLRTEERKLRGVFSSFTGTAAARFEQERDMWTMGQAFFRNQICSEAFGIWYGVWDSGKYWIAKPEAEADGIYTEPFSIPAGTYAVFTTDFGKTAGDELPPLRSLIFDCWLPDSGYVQARDFEIEVYHLSPKTEKEKRYYEIWIPVKNK